MKTKILCSLILVVLLLCSCNKAVPQETPKPTEKATVTFLTTPTPTARPTPTPTPPATKPEVSKNDRQDMLSSLNTYLDTVKFTGDIFTVTYVDDVALSGRYYAKYDVKTEKENVEYCTVTKEFYVDLLTKEIFAGSCLMSKGDYEALINKFKNNFSEDDLKTRHIKLSKLIFEETLNAYCYSVQLLSPGKDFSGTLGWYAFTEKTLKLYEKDMSPNQNFTEIA